MPASFSTVTDLIVDLAQSIDAGDANSSDYDLESLAFDLAEECDGRYSIDSDDFWEALPDYVLGIEVWARVGGAWQPLTVTCESDLAQVEHEIDDDHSWSGWSDLSGMIDAYIEAGYSIRR